MFVIVLGNTYFYNILQEMHRHKSMGSVMALQQLQNKSSPLSIFGLGPNQMIYKNVLYESKSCKELISKNYEKVCYVGTCYCLAFTVCLSTIIYCMLCRDVLLFGRLSNLSKENLLWNQLLSLK